MLYHAKNSCKMDSYPEIVGAQMSRWYRVCPATPRLRGAKGSEKSRLQMFILQRGPMKAGSVHTLQYDRLKTSRISTLFFAKTREIEEIVGKTFGTGLLQAERSNWWRNIGSEGFSESGLNLAWFQQRGSSLCGPRSAPQLESIRRKMTTWKHELALCPAAWFWGSATVIAYKIRQNRSQNSYSVTVIRTHQPKFRPKVSAYFFIYYHQLGGHHFCAPRKKKNRGTSVSESPFMAFHDMVGSRDGSKLPGSWKNLCFNITSVFFFKQMGCKQSLNVISKFGMSWWKSWFKCFTICSEYSLNFQFGVVFVAGAQFDHVFQHLKTWHNWHHVWRSVCRSSLFLLWLRKAARSFVMRRLLGFWITYLCGKLYPVQWKTIVCLI